MGLFGSKDMTEETKDPKRDSLSAVDQFVAKDPQAVYLIDGDKKTPRCVICRQNSTGGKTCLNLDVDGLTLFNKMQDIRYFCSLPANIDATHFECRKIN